MMRTANRVMLAAILLAPISAQAQEPPSRADVEADLRKAVGFFREKVAVEGGYVYRVGADLKMREGEDEAGTTRVWVQPPGTPAVGEAFLDAFEATGDETHLAAAGDVARCLVRGQLRSGGWYYFIEFDPAERRRYGYRDDPMPARKAESVTTLDDDTTQAALRFLLRYVKLEPADRPGRKEAEEAARYGLDALVKAQYPNGGWYVWWREYPEKSPSVDEFPVKRAGYPESWDRVWMKDYPGRYVTNDNLMEDVIDLLLLGHETLGDPRYMEAARRAGDFLVRAQMPDPQPAWAQQYDTAMHPAWARKFEPPAISGSESQGILEALVKLALATGDRKYLEPIPRAVAYLRSSLLPDGRLSRFYELETNRPLYFNKKYELTHEDNDLPTHYSFQVASRLDAIEAGHARAQERLRAGEARQATTKAPKPPSTEETAAVSRILAGLDDRGAWAEPGNLRGFDKAKPPGGIIASETFRANVKALCAYLGHRLPGDAE